MPTPAWRRATMGALALVALLGLVGALLVVFLAKRDPAPWLWTFFGVTIVALVGEVVLLVTQRREEAPVEFEL